MGYLDQQKFRLELGDSLASANKRRKSIVLLFVDSDLHFSPCVRLNEQVCLLYSLPLIADHVNFRFDIVGVLLIRSQNYSDEVRYIVA